MREKTGKNTFKKTLEVAKSTRYEAVIIRCCFGYLVVDKKKISVMYVFRLPFLQKQKLPDLNIVIRFS